MTVHAVFVDPLRQGLVLRELTTDTPLSEAEAVDLYVAMVKDTICAVANSGGELLVNYRPEEDIPEEHRTGTNVESEFRTLVERALEDPTVARYEVQVGSTYAARVGNTVTHLLREEGAASVAVLDGIVPTLTRTTLDSAAMKLRRSETVVAPAPGGRIAYLGVTDPFDFADAFSPPELETVVGRARMVDHDVDFLPMHPRVDAAADLATLVSTLNAREQAGRSMPVFTTDVLDRLNLRVVVESGDRWVVRGDTDRT